MIIPIIYEDDQLLAVNKPAGLAVHGDGRSDEYTLVNWLLDNHKVSPEIGEPMTLPSGATIDRPGIVHRLDKDTTGVLVIAKTVDAFLHLKDQFQSREMKKVYRAIVHGHLREKEGLIDVPIGRSRSDPRRRVASHKAHGRQREAVTLYSVLEVFPSYSYVEAIPRTGRTHQIRVHFKYLGCPVAGDKLYAPDRDQPDGLNHQALHAYSIELKTLAGGVLRLAADLPADFEATLDKLRTLC